MPTCSLGGFIAPNASIHYTYDALGSQHSATVCSGWITNAGSPLSQPTTPPPVGNVPPGLECEAVPPGGKRTSTATQPPANAIAFLIRVDFHDRTDTGLLVVFVNGQEVARGTLDACGVAIWTFDVNR